nr:fibrillin-2 isoform X1 [Crassostrea gigas]XP_034312992.1 fibrillin-2 isoform X1 [Crassostrea gigas]
MKLADNTMWSLMVGLALVWISGTDSQSFTERQLTPESAALVQSFRTYLSSVERDKRNELERIGRASSNASDPTCSLLCTDRKDCGNIIQNFGLYLDPKSAVRMCKSGAKNILVQSNYDTSPYCQYLQSHFNICENKTAVMEIGCQFTCEKCKVCDDDECKCSKNSIGGYVDGRYVCKCNKGFRGDGFTCININECKENTHDCHKTRANCTDLTPFWKCACKEGYSGDGKECEDVNECTTKAFPPGKACDTYATCTNTIGSYYCTCNQGFTGNGYFCEDIPECDRGTDKCARASDGVTRIASCTNTFGSYRCNCSEGYRDVNNPKDGKNCEDIDECKEGTHNCDRRKGNCTNTIGSFKCHCNEDYEGDGVRCFWKNPCTRGTHDCSENARCLAKSDETYDCECLVGYKDYAAEKGRDCRNRDECRDGSHGCDRNTTRATCTDVVGSYKCSCNKGWEGNGFPNCRDRNECIDGSHLCRGKASCVNTLGSYECACPVGYRLTEDGRSCVDINECHEESDNCHSYATCTNTQGSFLCSCNTGFEGSGVLCKDIDECYKRTANCDAREFCTNTIGSYTCSCKTVFERNEETGKCDDINECERRTDNCNKTYTYCKNTIGSYSCLCKTGFEPWSNDCRDINECRRNTHECSAHASCTNTWGSYTCSCRLGFEGNGRICNDTDECTMGTDNCPKPRLPGICTNTIGSFRCSCYKGYKYQNNQCIDKDECLLGTHTCGGSSYCFNTKGSYECRCSKGFEMKNNRCVDINECVRGTHSCDKRPGASTCTNTIGSYTCKCNTGYEGNGHICKDINECERGTHNCHSQATCTNTIASFKCTCNVGFEGSGVVCKDINECKRRTHNCHKDYGLCNNTYGSFKCCCKKPGFEGNGVICKDINECVRNTHDCHRPHAQCTNTIGSFTCSCKTGFEERNDGRVCIDIDECKRNTHNCHRPHAMCDNTIGSYKCRCKDGYRGDGYTCTPVKPCSEGSDDCSQYSTCTDLTQGGEYKCDCYFGFFGNGKQCTGSRGKRFLVLFMKNIEDPTETSPRPRHAQIYIASLNKTDVKITTSDSLAKSLKSKIDQTVSMNSNSEKIVSISQNVRVNDAVVENKAVMLEMSEVTSVFALNHDGYTSDSTLVLPIDRLGLKYVIPSTEPHNKQHSDYNSQLAFGAVQDQTRVKITLKLNSGQYIKYGGKKNRDGDKIIVTLNKYQTFQLSHNGDLTGTLIISSKPVAVFSGNRCNKLNSFGFCSHLVEQIPPMDSLDTTYIVPPHFERSGTMVRVVSAHTGSTTFSYTIDKSTSTKTIGTFGNFDITVSGKQAVVVDSKRQVLVLSFGLAARRQKNGDPYMTMVPGVNQYVHQYHVSVPQGFEKNYFAIMVKKGSKSSLLLDNDSISSKNTVSEASVTVKGLDYVVLTVMVNQGVHRVETKDRSRFGLMIYGHGHDDGYGFAANILGPGKL